MKKLGLKKKKKKKGRRGRGRLGGKRGISTKTLEKEVATKRS